MRFHRLTALMLIGAATPAIAGDKVVYAPVPAWVKPAPEPALAAFDDQPMYLLLDTQQRFEDGQSWNYFDTATRAASGDVVAKIGTVTLPWLPSMGDLIIHKVAILRDGKTIDLVAGGEKLIVLRREQSLEQSQIDGMLTATMQVEDLRVGDVLRVAYSVTNRDPTLKGETQGFARLAAAPFRVGFARERMIWPVGADIRWKASGTGAIPVIATAGGMRELTVTLPLMKQPQVPGDAPMRFKTPPILEASSFADWAAVSKLMAPLYKTEGLIARDSALDAEVKRIAGASTDPLIRTEAALELVQSQVRYLFNGLDTGNYVPQPPALSWSLRYGDCKAKTLLLLAILHGLGIEAEPVLANQSLRDQVSERLPAPGVFNHVLVRASVGGETLWLDGTDKGARLADIHDTPALGFVLPIRSAGAALMPIQTRAPARPFIEIDRSYDERAAINVPSPFAIRLTVRGGLAQAMQGAASQASADDLDTMAAKIIGDYIVSGVIAERRFAFDAAQGTATLVASGIAYPSWWKEDGRYRTSLDVAIGTMTFSPDRTRVAWRTIPVSTGEPQTMVVRTTIQLPSGMADLRLAGDQSFATPIAGVTIDRTATLKDRTATVVETLRASGREVPIAAIAPERARLARAKANLLRVEGPVRMTPRWKMIDTSLHGNGFAPALALLQKKIDYKPDEAGPFVERAWFYERTFQWQAAATDLDRALAIDADVATYLARSRMLEQLGKPDKALADAAAAVEIDPASAEAVTRLAYLRTLAKQHDAALGLLDEHIDTGGSDKPTYQVARANALVASGDRDGAMTTIDKAIEESPGNPSLLNERCWLKGTLSIALDTALKDCTKAIELSDSPEDALDSRAMVFFRLGRMQEARDDLDAALDSNDNAGSLFMRAVVRKQSGDTTGAAEDFAGARLMMPTVDQEYARYGIKP